MSAPDQPSRALSPAGWLANQPYVLLTITALCWAGNAIVGRQAAGHIPPVTLSFLRWGLAFLIILPMAWKHLARLGDNPRRAWQHDLSFAHRDRRFQRPAILVA
jgi:drug/metabolite transporter (DMT)-like permease